MLISIKALNLLSQFKITPNATLIHVALIALKYQLTGRSFGTDCMLEKDNIFFPDKNLLQLLRDDSKFAFDQIYSRYWEALFLYVVKVVSDSDDAKDIVQEVFVSLWNRRFELGEIRSLKAYLFTSARYQGLSFINNKFTKQKYLNSLATVFSEESDLLNEQLDAGELNRLIDVEISNLPSKMREVFILSRRDNLSYKQISEKLDISDKTVKKQINNVLKQFRLKFSHR